jgi:hypothetical protein
MTSATRCAFLLASALASSVAAQSAAFTTFGTSCSYPGSPAPAIGAATLPRLGTTFRVTYSGPNAIDPGIGLTDHPVLILGSSRIAFPWPQLSAVQPAGCTVWASPDLGIVTPVDVSGRAYVPQVDLPIPNVPAMAGANVFLQWVTVHDQCGFSGCNPGIVWLVFSEGGRATLGT